MCGNLVIILNFYNRNDKGIVLVFPLKGDQRYVLVGGDSPGATPFSALMQSSHLQSGVVPGNRVGPLGGCPREREVVPGNGRWSQGTGGGPREREVVPGNGRGPR
jgi:hypothetical protein